MSRGDRSSEACVSCGNLVCVDPGADFAQGLVTGEGLVSATFVKLAMVMKFVVRSK